MIFESEKIYKSNDTYFEYSKNKTLHELFQIQADLMPSKVAAVCKNRCITYHELEQKSNILGRKLRNKGISPNDIVGLICSRTINMFIAILGILKAGGCYLPIDNKFPEERINYILEDSKTKVLLTDSCLPNHLEFDGQIIDMNAEEGSDFRSINNVNSANDLAYVIYTSGSTGQPKGVMIEHKSVNNFITGMKEKINFESSKTILSLTTISFDIFILESIVPLVLGMRILIADPLDFESYVENHTFNMLQTTPSTMKLLLKDVKNVKYFYNLTEIMLGGEPFPRSLVLQLKEVTNAKIYNMYGPTETTVWSTVKEVVDEYDVCIGTPIANTQIYILNKNNDILGMNEIGELCICGDGVARGYLYRPKLTDEKFVDIPNIGVGRIYRTGDLAKWNDSGEIEFIGRTDRQVKLRGFRIELGEIEDCLSKFYLVVDGLIEIKTNIKQEKCLIYYYVSEYEISVTEFYNFAKQKLPEYMIPELYIRLDEIPLTPNGKVDRKALPDIGTSRPILNQEYVEPSTKIENGLCNIFQDILNIDNIGINDNIFELGTNSILVNKLCIEINENYNHTLKTSDLYSYPTIKGLVQHIEALQESVDDEIEDKIVRLPDNYLINDRECVNYGICNIDININSVLNHDNKLSYNLFEAVYLFLISQICNQVKFYFQEVEINNSRKTLYVDFSITQDLFTICEKINKMRNSGEEEHSRRTAKVQKIRSISKSIIPVFYMNQHVNMQNKDLGLFIKIDKDRLYIQLFYDKAYIFTSKAEELLHKYIEFLETVLNAF